MFSVLNLICKNYFASLAFVTFAQVVGTTRKYPQKVVLTYLISLVSQPYLVFSFLFFFCHTQGIWTFPGQRSSSSHSCDLHCFGVGDQTCIPSATQATAIRSLTHVPQWKLPVTTLFLGVFLLGFFFFFFFVSFLVPHTRHMGVPRLGV